MNIKDCKIRYYLFVLFLVINNSLLKAQIKDTFSVDFRWNGIEKNVFYGDTVNMLSFDNAVYDELNGTLPLYRKMIPVYSEDVCAAFDVIINDYEMVPSEELPLISQKLDSIPYHDYVRSISRDNCNLCFTLSPFYIKNDTVMRILSCDVSYSLKEQRLQSRNVYADNSVLDSGKWYKLSLTSTGMYKITYSELSSMGVSVSSINPKDIRIYHNGGGVLPAINGDARHDDLVEIPIYVHGESDGSFDSSDYIVFYARGPRTWTYKNGVYERVHNPYSDYSYVFLTTDLGEGKRIQNAEYVDDKPDETVTSFLDYQLTENDYHNLGNMGSSWYFDEFNTETSRTYTYTFPNLIKTKQCNLKSEVASANMASSATFRFKANGVQLCSLNFNKISESSLFARLGDTDNKKFESSSDVITINVDYIKSGSASGWIDYIAVNAWRNLKMSGNVMLFRNPECSDSDKVYKYELGNASSSMQVWDVTNPVEPKKVQLQYSSNVASFNVRGAENNEFVAFSGNGYGTVNYESMIQNQNLHAKYNFDYLIIAHPDFYSHAQRLKNIHAAIDDLSIEIVTPQQIYNEFSCGALDITAIRDYIKMVYDKSDKRLRYVLLFGDASFDYKNRSGQVCFIPSYESLNSSSTSSYVTDDYFACLDAGEGNMEDSSSVIDVAIGRMPVSTSDDANAMLDKIETYLTKDKESMGTWRKLISFVTDDDNHTYSNHAEKLEKIIKDEVGDDVIVDKIYLDSYHQVATSSGQRSPECNAAITNRVELGSLIVTYIGHAGEVGWAEERILMNEDIYAWRNSPKLNLMITASCEFSRFDDHTRTSAGEYVFLNRYGGSVAMITTARVTYSPNNFSLMRGFYNHLFDMEGGDYLTMGDLYVYAKQVGDRNSKAFVFFGDPALRLNYPKNKIEITSVNGHDVGQVDTLRALQKCGVTGVVKDVFGNVMPDFNGVLHINIYDKENSYTTLGDEADPYFFKLRNSVIYSGKVMVENGEFSADFTLPKDINYSYGNGVISMYAYSDNTDAQGSFSNFIVGGMNPDAEQDDVAPEIKLYIDDLEFTDGSLTNENPLLIAYIKDKNGINTSIAGIGHDITATLTGATNKTYTLNQFYDPPLYDDEYGVITYKFYDLEEGEHQLTFRVWDIYNNSNTAQISFNVKKGKEIDIENVINYPNPMTDHTKFTFDHNQKDNEIDVHIKIYNMMGQLVRTIKEHRYGTTMRVDPISWDGTSDKGHKVPAGMYVYYVTVTNSQKEQSSGYSKLIIK